MAISTIHKIWRKSLTSVSNPLIKTRLCSSSPEIPTLYSFLQPSIFALKPNNNNTTTTLTTNQQKQLPTITHEQKSKLETTLHQSLLTHNTDEAWKSFKSLTSHSSAFPSKTLTNSLITNLASLKDVHNLKRAFASIVFVIERNPTLLEFTTVQKVLEGMMFADTAAPAFALVKCMFKNRYFMPFELWGNSLVDISRKNRSFVVFLRVFEETCRICLDEKLEFMKPDLRACNAALEGCCRELESVSDAEKVVETMSVLGVRPDEMSFGFLAYLYASKGAENKINELQNLMSGFGFSNKTVFYSNLVSGYVNSGNLDSVSDTFVRSLSEKDGYFTDENYCEVVKGFLKDGGIKQLASLIIKAQELEVSTNLVDNSIGYGIINACVNLGMLDKAHSILDDMNAQGGSVGLGVYVPILKAYCKEYRTAEATQLVMDISNSGLQLPVESYDPLIEASMASQDFPSAFTLFRDMREARLPDLKGSYLTIMTGLMENHRPELMAAFLDEIVEDPRVEVKTHDWNSIIHAFCKAGRLEDAKRTLRRMIFLQFEPNDQTYLSLINGYVVAEKYFSVLMLWNEVKRKVSVGGDKGVRFDQNLVDAFLYALVKGGFFDAVMQVVEKSQEMKIFVDKWKYKQAFMETHKKLKIAKLRRRSFRKMEALIAFKNWAGNGCRGTWRPKILAKMTIGGTDHKCAEKWRKWEVTLFLIFFRHTLKAIFGEEVTSHIHPLSRIAIHKTTFAVDDRAYVKVTPTKLGLSGQSSEWVTVEFSSPTPSADDWIGVFSPANFSAATCPSENPRVNPPLLCTAPIKFQFANYSTPKYKNTGNGSLRLQLINQRSDFSFALFSGGLSNPKLVSVSNKVSFTNPKAPVYPRLAQGKAWNEMTVTWTSGYGLREAYPFVEWGSKGGDRERSPAGTLTIDRNSMCGMYFFILNDIYLMHYLCAVSNKEPSAHHNSVNLSIENDEHREFANLIEILMHAEFVRAPAKTVGWRDPGYIHTSFLKELWPNLKYTYKLGHKLLNGTYIWSQEYQFTASPYPGQDSLQRVVIFGDMGKDEADGSNEYNNFQPGSLNTTKQLTRDLDNIDIVFHIGDLSYANGYLSQWDQFTAQVEPITSAVPYMIASGNHERDWPDSGSFYNTLDSGGECGVLSETMFFVPAENRAKFWYSTDYGMFRFCIADTEHDWREGTEQYKFIEHCLASVDRQKQPWLIFLAHRVLGYSSTNFYAMEGSFAEPMGRESMQKLWQKYKVDVVISGHAHNYERTCPIYQNICTSTEKHFYKGTLNGTIHVVAGGGGAALTNFANLEPTWSYVKDVDYGYVKLTAFDHSNMLFEYMKSSNGKVYDSFRISRDYRDILACTVDSCESTTLAS
ncbi:hypothetical protein ACFE04_023134 [Oxalis oulophora]